MIAIIRIRGLVNIKEKVEETLSRLRLRRKYSCVLIDEKEESIMGMLDKVRDFVAYGDINPETLTKLIKHRGKKVNKKEIKEDEAVKISKELLSGKTLKDLEIKPFFRLHPPRGGIKSKLAYPRGVLGNHKDKINELIERML